MNTHGYSLTLMQSLQLNVLVLLSAECTVVYTIVILNAHYSVTYL